MHKQILQLIGENIKAARKFRGIGLNELASGCGIEKASMSRIESGKTNITIATLVKIAFVLGLEARNLFE